MRSSYTRLPRSRVAVIPSAFASPRHRTLIRPRTPPSPLPPVRDAAAEQSAFMLCLMTLFIIYPPGVFTPAFPLQFDAQWIRLYFLSSSPIACVVGVTGPERIHAAATLRRRDDISA